MRLTGLWWWIDRWRKSTAYTDLTLEEQGAYRNLLDEAALRGGPIPNNEDTLAKACGDARKWRRVRNAVLARFTLGPDGWRNATLDEVLAESIRRAEKQRRYRQGKNAPYVLAIIERDGRVCGICALPVDGDAFEIDHVIPISDGGDPEHLDNLQLAHPKCNAKKGARSRARHASLPAVFGRYRSNAQSNAQ